jgi:hypothetical protein
VTIAIQRGRGNFNSLNPSPPPGAVNVIFQLDDSVDPGDVSGYVPAAGGGGGGAAVAIVVDLLAPGIPGNFTIAHGAPSLPTFVLIQMTSGGAIWLQSPVGFDGTNLYLTSGDPSITGVAYVFMSGPDEIIPFTASAPGDFSVPHSLGVSPGLALVEMNSSGAVWFQIPSWDAFNIFLESSGPAVTGNVLVWKMAPIITTSEFTQVILAPPVGGPFTMAHGLGVVPEVVVIRMTSGGAIWLQSPVGFDATNLYLVASDPGISGVAEIWVSGGEGSALPLPVSVPNGGTGDASLPADSVLIGNGTSPVTGAPPVSAGYVLTDNGPGVAPSFQLSSIGSFTPFGETVAFSGTAGSLSRAPSPVSFLQLTKNGIALKAGIGNDFTISGTAITLAVAAAGSDVFQAFYLYVSVGGFLPFGEAVAFSGTAGTLSHAPNPTSFLQLTKNGVVLQAGAGNDFTISGTAITLAVAPSGSDVFQAFYGY